MIRRPPRSTRTDTLFPYTTLVRSAGRRAYDLETIRRWLEVFLKRFFGFSQFKRSALPNGPKVSAGGALSPRGDWRAPSDGVATPWLDELKRNRSEERRVGKECVSTCRSRWSPYH